MQSFLTALIECSVAMSVLILLFIAITPLLSKRYAAKWRYYAWLVIVIGLIIPFRPHLDTALIQMDIPVAPSYIQQMILGNAGTVGDNNSQTGIQQMMSRNAGNVGDNNSQIVTIRQKLAAIPWYQWADFLWIVGAVIFISYHGIRHLRFLKIVKRWSQEVSDQQTQDTLQGLQANLESKHVKLRVCPCITSPMMIGFINPVILLPSTNFPVDDMAFILKHEMVHFKRKDLWYKSLVLLATAIHWFNPVVYLMARAIAVQCEISCDEEVVQSTDMDKRQQYSEAIIRVIKNQSRMQTTFSTNFYGGKKEMKNRILSIMDTTKKKTGVFILCIVLIGTMGIGTLFASANTSGDLKPLSERGGAIATYYNPFETLETNVLTTFGKQVPGKKIQVKHLPSSDYIDINGRKIDLYNRTEPYYYVKWNWTAKDSEVKNYVQKTLLIDGKNVTFAFSDKAASYKDDKVIEKMLNNMISFASVYKDKTFHYDYKAFIDELIDKGICVIQEITTPENCGWRYSVTKDTGFLASKVLTKYDRKDKVTSVYNGKIRVQVNINGNQGIQIGNSFTIRAGETLAIDIKETTDKMPTVNWAIVDVTAGKTIDWMPNALGGNRFIWTPSDNYVNHTFKITTSTEEMTGDNAVFEIFTYKTGQ